MGKKSPANLGLYLVKPEVKPGVVWPSIPKDAKPTESQYAYFARKYMEIHSKQSDDEKCPTEKSVRHSLREKFPDPHSSRICQ